MIGMRAYPESNDGVVVSTPSDDQSHADRAVASDTLEMQARMHRVFLQNRKVPIGEITYALRQPMIVPRRRLSRNASKGLAATGAMLAKRLIRQSVERGSLLPGCDRKY
jgi:hypothetical protein